VTGPGADGATVARIERLLPSPPEVVYRAWTDPLILGRWMSAFGRAEVTADVRVGGRLHVAMVDDDVRIEHEGVFLVLDPPSRLSFTWRSPYTGPEPSVVTVELTPRGAGTRLVLTHERLPDEVVTSHLGGWGRMVDRLADLLGAGAGPAAAAEEVAR
jgi:uncharacterized protein YndB with AHSA1/START domain